MIATLFITLVGGGATVLLATACIACALMYASAFAEEHVALTGKLLNGALRLVLGLHLVLLIDGVFATWAVLGSICCHLCERLR